MHVAYNVACCIMMMMMMMTAFVSYCMNQDGACSASQLFVANNVPSFDGNIRKLVYSLWRLLNVSDNVLVRTALCSDLFAISPVFRRWQNILFFKFYLAYCISLYFIVPCV